MNLGVSLFNSFFLYFNVFTCVYSGKIGGKEKRSILSLPSGSSLYITTDLIIPVLPLLNTTLTYLMFDFPITFDVPTAKNLNELYGSFASTSSGKDNDNNAEARGILDHGLIEDRKANYDRRQVYKYLEGFLENFGVDGPACLQRLICELAETPLGSHGLMGKISELFFNPSSDVKNTLQQFDLNLNTKFKESLPEELHFIYHSIDDDYSQAYRTGKQGVGCHAYSKTCFFSIFKTFHI